MRFLPLLAALALPLSAFAGEGPESDPRWKTACEAPLPEGGVPAERVSLACAEHWLVRGYGPGWDAEATTLDPSSDAGPAPGLALADLDRLGEAMQAACPASDPPYEVTRCDRAAEVLRALRSRARGFDEPFSGFTRSFEQPLRKALAGEALGAEDLRPAGQEGWSKPTLRLLRNAVFARHGRAFQSADLVDFFYGRDSAARFGKALAVDADYDDGRLTDLDRANVAALTQAEGG